jgi:hypothetical protein
MSNAVSPLVNTPITAAPVSFRQTIEARFQANLQRVYAINPPLARELEHFPLHNLNLLVNPKGQIVGTAWDVKAQQWVPLCNPADPEGEAEADAAALWTPDAKIFNLFGLGLGYFASAIAKRLLPYQRIAILETRPVHLAAAMRAVDMADLLGVTGKRVDTITGDNIVQGLENWWLTLESHEKFHISPPLMSGFTQQIDQEVYRTLVCKAADMHRYHMVGLATWRQFGPLIGRNDLANLPEYCITPGINAFQDAWQGKPAVCIAAGPSLKKNLHLLTDPELRSRVCVITVGTCYALLKALHIEPDIVTTIDFQRLNFTDQFQHVPLDDLTPLVYLHSTSPETPRRWPGPRFVSLNASDTISWLAPFCEPKAATPQVQTVAHLNLLVAHMLGADPIILLGQDLSMPKDEHHAPGARVQDCSPQDSPENHVEAVDYQGNPCWTRHSFLSMKTVFEQLIRQCEGRTVVNCTEGGLALAGAANRPLLDVLKDCFDIYQGTPLKQALARVFAEYQPQTRWDDLHGFLHQLRGQVDELYDIACQVLDLDAKRQANAELGLEAQPWNNAIMAYEARLTQHPQAFNQYAIRAFDMIELLSAIPLAASATEADQKLYTVTRIVRTAQCMVREAATIKRVMDATLARFQDVYNLYHAQADHLECLSRLYRNQSFHVLTACSRDHDHWQARLAWQQQWYSKAVIMGAGKHAERARRKLVQFDASMQRLRQAYYRPVEWPLSVDVLPRLKSGDSLNWRSTS